MFRTVKQFARCDRHVTSIRTAPRTSSACTELSRPGHVRSVVQGITRTLPGLCRSSAEICPRRGRSPQSSVPRAPCVGSAAPFRRSRQSAFRSSDHPISSPLREQLLDQRGPARPRTSFSNWASDAKTLAIIRPAGVVRSRPSFRLTKPTPRSCRSANRAVSPFAFRPSRSSRQQQILPIFPASRSACSLCHPGRSIVFPVNLSRIPRNWLGLGGCPTLQVGQLGLVVLALAADAQVDGDCLGHGAVPSNPVLLSIRQPNHSPGLSVWHAVRLIGFIDVDQQLLLAVSRSPMGAATDFSAEHSKLTVCREQPAKGEPSGVTGSE